MPCEPARVQVLDLGNEIHNLNILDRALLIGGESWLDGGVVVENIGACVRAGVSVCSSLPRPFRSLRY